MKAKTAHIDDDSVCLWHYPEQGIIHHQFLKPVTDEVFRSVLMSGLRVLQEHGADRWLSDDRKNSIWPPEIGAWSEEFWLPRASKAGWKYWAMVPPAGALGRIKVERMIGYAGEQFDITGKRFSDPDEAWQWLAQPAPTP